MNGLYALKPWYTARLHRVVAAAVRRGTSPDVFTAAGVLAAGAAGVAVRPWGFVLNELGDRASDLLVLAGLAFLAARTAVTWSDPVVVLVLVATIAATLPTFASLAASGAGATRRNGGPFGKTERCAAVVVATAFPPMIVWVALAVVLGSVVTAGLRLRAAHRELAARAEVA